MSQFGWCDVSNPKNTYKRFTQLCPRRLISWLVVDMIGTNSSFNNKVANLFTTRVFLAVCPPIVLLLMASHCPIFLITWAGKGGCKLTLYTCWLNPSCLLLLPTHRLVISMENALIPQVRCAHSVSTHMYSCIGLYPNSSKLAAPPHSTPH